MTGPMLQAENLTVQVGEQPLVNGVSFTLERGGRLGIIGESGSGKSLTALSIIGLLPDNLTASGAIHLDGESLLDMDERHRCDMRGNAVSMIFQEPMTALNPLMRIRRQIAEPLRLHRGVSKSDAFDAAVDLLGRVGIDQPARRALSFPHELSGGQRQRAMIAMAIACSPDVIIADEPTTALDVTVQAQILELLDEQVDANDAGLILITHDLPVVASMTDHVVVLRNGEMVEHGPTKQVFRQPEHPYTASLLDSVPPLSRSSQPAATPRQQQASDPAGEREPVLPEPIVVVENLRKTYRLRKRSFREAAPTIHALDDVSLEILPGETFGVVGESGSGKSTLAKAMIALVEPTAGTISVDGIDVTGGDLAPLRRTAQMVFQDPNGSLDPRMKVADLVAEPMRSLDLPGDHGQRVAELLDAVSLPADSIRKYPHEFSGGQRQRIAIARALAPKPRLLIADEPVSALDMSVQTVTLELLADLKERFDLTMVFISHDLSVVHEICERVIVLERGKIVERGDVVEVFGSPQQDYTKQLIDAIPRLDA